MWRDNSRRVRTHKNNSGETVRRLGTIIRSIFCAQSGASIGLNFWKWFGESRYPGALPALLENFRRAFSPDPTDCPWVSEDGPIRAQPISYPESSGLLVGGITLPKKTEYDPKMTRRRPEDSTGPKTDPVDTGYEIASSEERHTFRWIWLPSFCDLLGKNHVRA